MDQEKATAAAMLLEQVARGDLEASVALNQWPQDTESDELLKVSWHDLSHFAVDRDIRGNDPRYKTYQVAGLLERVKQIKAKYGVR
jgi:hypothetical protein